jgi:dipeptidyl aminopeptidase/acylaminoacyl peptidase
MKIAMACLLGIILIVFFLPVILVYINTHPPRYTLNIPPSIYNADYEDVAFTGKAGIVLKGWLIRPVPAVYATPAIIICHGVGANKSDFTELAVHLSRRGYAVLLFDFRAHGESGGSRTSLGYHEQEDVLAALAYLKTRHDVDPRRIGIYGFSLGGAAAILAAAKSDGFRAIVADSAFTSLRDQARTTVTDFYHLPSFPFLPLAVLVYEVSFRTPVDAISPVGSIAMLASTPILIIAGDGDTLIPSENGRRLYAVAREPKEIWIIPGADHGGTLAAAGVAYEKRVGGFFDKYLQKTAVVK